MSVTSHLAYYATFVTGVTVVTHILYIVMILSSHRIASHCVCEMIIRYEFSTR